MGPTLIMLLRYGTYESSYGVRILSRVEIALFVSYAVLFIGLYQSGREGHEVPE